MKTEDTIEGVASDKHDAAHGCGTQLAVMAIVIVVSISAITLASIFGWSFLLL